MTMILPLVTLAMVLLATVATLPVGDQRDFQIEDSLMESLSIGGDQTATSSTGKQPKRKPRPGYTDYGEAGARHPYVVPTQHPREEPHKPCDFPKVRDAEGDCVEGSFGVKKQVQQIPLGPSGANPHIQRG